MSLNMQIRGGIGIRIGAAIRNVLILLVACSSYSAAHGHYSAELGRWLTRDPAAYVDGPSLYLYAHSNSPRHADPTGTVVVGFTGGGDIDPGRILEDTASDIAGAAKGENWRLFKESQAIAAKRFVQDELRAQCQQAVILFGHSYGADAALQAAGYLRNREHTGRKSDPPPTTVDYLVTLDPVWKLFSRRVPSNVTEAENYYETMSNFRIVRGRRGFGAVDINVGPWAISAGEWSKTHVLKGPNAGEDKEYGYWAFHADVPRVSTLMNIHVRITNVGIIPQPIISVINWVEHAKDIVRRRRQ
jgi:hypothetical protein